MLLVLFVFILDSCSPKRPIPDEAEPEPEIDPVELSLSYLEEGVKLEEGNQLVEAYEKYKLALTANPENGEALKRKERLDPKMQRLSEIHYTAGMKFMKKGKKESAQREFLEATRLWPENEKAARMLDAEKKSQAELTGDYITYTMKPGDSLSKLAKKYYGDLRKYTIIADFNQITDPANTRAGQIIKIPKIKGMTSHEAGEKASAKQEKAEVQEQESPLSAETAPQDAEAAPYAPPSDEIEGGGAAGQIIADPLALEQTETAAAVTETDEDSETSGDDVASAIDSYRESGTGYYNKNNFEMAITEFNKVLNASPDDQEAIDYLGKSHYNQGVMLFEKKDYLKAKEQFALSEKYDSSCKNCEEYSNKCEAEYKDMHYKKGVAFYSQQKLKEALTSWRLVESLDPNYMDVQKHISKAENLLKRLEEIKKE